MISTDLNRNRTSGSEESSECLTLQLSHALHWISVDLSSSVKLLLLQTHFYFKSFLERKQDEQIFLSRRFSQKSPLTLINTLLLVTLHRLMALPNQCKSRGALNPFTHLLLQVTFTGLSIPCSHFAASCDRLVHSVCFTPERKFSNNRLPKKISRIEIHLFPWTDHKQTNSASSRYL